MMTSEILKVENVSKVFEDGTSSVKVLKDISFTLNKGELIAIMGPSGSGKSTLLSIIGALLTPSSGKVIIGNEVITEVKPAKLTSIRAEKIGFIFQSANLIPYLTIKDQFMLVANIQKANRTENLKKVQKLCNDLDLNHHLHHYPRVLSGGEKQRVAIGRAFMNDPDIILADEPTASLDSERGNQVVQRISHEVKSRNKAAIMVTHDERILHVCDRALYIEDGQLFEKRNMKEKH